VVTSRIIQDRLESDDLASIADTTGTDIDTAGATLKQYTDDVELKVAEIFETVRPLIAQTISDTRSLFTTLETRYSDSSNEGAFSEAALTVVADGRSAFDLVLTAAEEDETATESAVIQIVADYVARTLTNVQTPAQSTNEALTNLGALVSQQQTSHEELDAGMAGRVSR
jgi:hypothetical protein